ITIGKTNPNDTLEITSTFATASLSSEGGDGVNATIIIDGPVDNINSFCPVTHASSASGRFDIDIVVKGAATTDAGKLIYRGSDYTVNVYADDRVDGAEEFAAIVVGAENVQPYKRYCVKVNGAHPDENEDTICDNCGASTACEHESGEWRETVAADCANTTVYTWYCFDCRELIADMTKRGDAVDSTNHVSENFTWQYADEKYFFACTACGTNVEQTTPPVLYVSQSGNNALDGTTAEKAVATVEEAVSRIANVGGTVVICGEYVLSENLTLPSYEKEITISGFDNAGEYGSFTISKNVVITLGGKTKFDKIGFGGTSIYVFECMWNDTVFGTVQPYGKATSYIVLGSYGITADDTEEKAATLAITEGTSQRHTASGVRYVDRFYGRVYLGDTFAADGIGVSGKTATLNATNADIGILYTMSTSGTYKNNPVTACETTVNLYGATKVDKGRTGDYNVAYADSTASLAKQTLNFFDDSYIGSNYYIRNANETVINVSTADEGRTIPLRCPFAFYVYGTFVNENTPMNVSVNYGTHSFASVVETPCTFSTAADALKVYSETKTNECEYASKVTEAATPTQNGTLLYSCTCGRSYTEEYAYSCADATHLYIAKADGTFECTVCGETFETVSGDNQFALSPITTSGDTVEVALSVNAAAIAAAQINVTAPEGFTFTGASIPDVEGFFVSASESDPCMVTLLSATGANAAINTNLTLTYSVAETVAFGDYVFELTVPEIYNENGETALATPVSATVTVAADEEIVYVAQIGDVKYETLADAFAAAVEGDTIVALEKITVTGTEVWDLTGKTLELAVVADNYALVVKGNLTIEGGNFVANTLFGIGVTGTLTVNGGTFSTDKDYYLIGTWGETTINGGEFTAVYNNVNCFAGTLNITGGNFTVTGTDEEYPSSDVFAEDGGAVAISGGMFSTDPSDYIAEGYEAVEADGVYGIVEKVVQEVAGDIDGDGSVTIKDALDLIRAIVNDQTVENGDVNGDGKVDLADVIRVFKLIVK
ncbi:MAG: dockerin type I repeat-containing protein, partial [Clostridia bacterium]|nr:dockerin type I repeat-containing protein [Clostridia bacterium]